MNKEIEFAKSIIKNKGYCPGYFIKGEKYNFSCIGCPYYIISSNFSCWPNEAYNFFVTFLNKKGKQLEFEF